MGRRQCSDVCRHVRQRSQACDQQFDLALALVSRGVEDINVILCCEMWGHEAHGAEMQRSVGEAIQDRREPPGSPCGFDAQIGGVLRKVEYLYAVSKERGAALLCVQLARLDFHEQRDDLRRRLAFIPDRVFELRQQIEI